MRTSIVEANLVTLNQDFGLPYIGELVDRKITGAEQGVLEDGALDFHRQEFDRLTVLLEQERGRSHLPAEASARDELNDLLIQLRTKQG